MANLSCSYRRGSTDQRLPLYQTGGRLIGGAGDHVGCISWRARWRERAVQVMIIGCLSHYSRISPSGVRTGIRLLRVCRRKSHGSHCGSQVVHLGYGWNFTPWLRRRRHLLRSPERPAGTAPITLKDLTVQDVRTALKKIARPTRPGRCRRRNCLRCSAARGGQNLVRRNMSRGRPRSSTGGSCVR